MRQKWTGEYSVHVEAFFNFIAYNIHCSLGQAKNKLDLNFPSPQTHLSEVEFWGTTLAISASKEVLKGVR
jgi:hypothetical protein